MTATAPTVQDALSALLASLGFRQMALDVKTETETARLRKYARVILNDCPVESRRSLYQKMALLGLA